MNIHKFSVYSYAYTHIYMYIYMHIHAYTHAYMEKWFNWSYTTHRIMLSYNNKNLSARCRTLGLNLLVRSVPQIVVHKNLMVRPYCWRLYTLCWQDMEWSSWCLSRRFHQSGFYNTKICYLEEKKVSNNFMKLWTLWTTIKTGIASHAYG